MESRRYDKKVSDILKRKVGKEMIIKNSEMIPRENDINPEQGIQIIIESKEDYAIPVELQANREWKNKAIVWFSKCNECLKKNLEFEPKDKVQEFKSIVRSIESGELPLLTDVYDFSIALKILEYFSEKDKYFSKSELNWLFSAFINIEKNNGDIYLPLMKNILKKIVNQISAISNEDELYPYLMVVYVIIPCYF